MTVPCATRVYGQWMSQLKVDVRLAIEKAEMAVQACNDDSNTIQAKVMSEKTNVVKRLDCLKLVRDSTGTTLAAYIKDCTTAKLLARVLQWRLAVLADLHLELPHHVHCTKNSSISL